MRRRIPRSDTVAGFLLMALMLWAAPLHALEEEKNYEISLVKTAEEEDGKKVYELENRKVLTETYTVQEGDWVWKMFRQRGLLRKRNLSELLSLLKKLNTSLDNLDIILPGQKIIVPLKISPIGDHGAGHAPAAADVKPLTPEELEDIDLENYTVERGDSLIKVIKGRYGTPPEGFYERYLEAAKRLNPSVKDLDLIYPGQVIRLPVYTSQVVRKPIEPEPAETETAEPEKKPEPEKVEEEVFKEALKKSPNPLVKDIGALFTTLGEEWVHTGTHFLLLKSGSQMELNAESFPIINFEHGPRVVVDAENKLPEEMASLIVESGKNYRVVRLEQEDDLRTVLDKIFKVSRYPKLYKKGDPLELEGAIPFKITGDWIVARSLSREDNEDNKGHVAVINLINAQSQGTPAMIRRYLKRAGVRVIDYPRPDDPMPSKGGAKPIDGGKDAVSSVKAVLELTGREFSTKAEIPVFKSREVDYRVLSRADFLLKVKGKEAIIDLTGLADQMVAALEEQDFRYLALMEDDPIERVAELLLFLDIPFEPGPQTFMATSRDVSRNIGFKVPGVVFVDSQGRQIFATPLNLPSEITDFLSARGFEILALPSA